MFDYLSGCLTITSLNFQILMNAMKISTTAMKRLQRALIMTVHFFVNAMWATSIVPRQMECR